MVNWDVCARALKGTNRGYLENGVYVSAVLLVAWASTILQHDLCVVSCRDKSGDCVRLRAHAMGTGEVVVPERLWQSSGGGRGRWGNYQRRRDDG